MTGQICVEVFGSETDMQLHADGIKPGTIERFLLTSRVASSSVSQLGTKVNVPRAVCIDGAQLKQPGEGPTWPYELRVMARAASARKMSFIVQSFVAVRRVAKENSGEA